MLVLASLMTFGFAFTITLWATGIGSASGEAAISRLGRLKGTDTGAQQSNTAGAGLRRRASVSFAGVNLISGNVAAKWTIDLERGGLAFNVRE
ncbi:MAG: hypothetical protein ABI305_07985, partial [Tepidiformaceae bacterium]